MRLLGRREKKTEMERAVGGDCRSHIKGYNSGWPAGVGHIQARPGPTLKILAHIRAKLDVDHIKLICPSSARFTPFSPGRLGFRGVHRPGRGIVRPNPTIGQPGPARAGLRHPKPFSPSF